MDSLDITLSCGHCGRDTALPDIKMKTWHAWQCEDCGGWTNWMKTTTADDDQLSNVTQRGNSPFCTPRSLNHLWEPKGYDWPVLPGIPVAPGEGKSKGLKKLMKKLMKKLNKGKKKKSKYKWTTFKAATIDPKDLMGNLAAGWTMPPWYDNNTDK